ncbi:hypothetical protein [Paraburkholderia oxyphila]|uniref:hypothetical protein n=1 Tax=Paraburkholderia oxyphila TaxID=614212 RepID=UPI0012EDC68C|nr:hypothetical protein [Paraburkholderia oxyphila]
MWHSNVAPIAAIISGLGYGLSDLRRDPDPAEPPQKLAKRPYRYRKVLRVVDMDADAG